MIREIHVRVLLVALWCFTLTMALLPKPPKLPIDQMGDKFEHILAFAVLGALARIAFGRASDRLILERMSFAGALIELFQSIPALHRDCDWRDWVADTLAVAAVLLVLRLLPWRRLVGQAA